VAVLVEVAHGDREADLRVEDIDGVEDVIEAVSAAVGRAELVLDLRAKGRPGVSLPQIVDAALEASGGTGAALLVRCLVRSDKVAETLRALLQSPEHRASRFRLTLSTLRAALGSLQRRARVEILLPKFSFQTRVGLNAVLAGLGMRDVFTGAADLSGIDGARDLYVSLVVQQARIDVDEQGTAAAAATGVVVSDWGGTFPLRIDRPFLFLLRDTSTGSVLFMGRVEDRRAGS
jgi:Serpin (serine protease inhibitor)